MGISTMQMKKIPILLLLLLISCSDKERRFQLPDKTYGVYQKIKILDVKTIKEHSKKGKYYYEITVLSSKNDTSVVYSRNIFYRGEYWAETVEDKYGEIVSVIDVDEYETVKLN